MATNNFKPFAIGVGANVMSQADWEALPALLTGFSSGKASSAQVNKAIRQATFIASSIAQFVSDALNQDVLDNGNGTAFTAALKQAVINGSVPAGIPMPWPTATPPGGWLKCNGANFNVATYPLLAVAYPSGKLPDLRGEFLRGWDDGRGVDSSRGVLTSQSDGTKTQSGTMWARQFKVAGASGGTESAAVQTPSGVFSIEVNAATTGWDYIENTKSGVVSGANRITLNIGNAAETRPRNIAFNYIVRAA